MRKVQYKIFAINQWFVIVEKVVKDLYDRGEVATPTTNAICAIVHDYDSEGNAVEFIGQINLIGVDWDGFQALIAGLLNEGPPHTVSWMSEADRLPHTIKTDPDDVRRELGLNFSED